MRLLNTIGVDVVRILTGAHHAGVGVDQAVAAVTAAAAGTPAPTPAGTRGRVKGTSAPA
ncbi:hypothetical protein ACFWWA_34205 [Streptomyces goshikiensis]|uniref:hypothetical protein n=1 Tax=Streptomyces goshikiensis TaxID=1942 RepID=UPI003647026A